MIKLLTAMSGHTFNYPIGEIVSLGKDYEKRLIDSGQALKVSEPKKKAKK